MQQLSVIGNLGADVEVRNFGDEKYLSFKVADTQKFTDNKGVTQERTTWVSCLMKDNDRLAPYLSKGVKVFVQGRPSYRVYSSEKLRCMLAGVDLFVTQLELCGGSSASVRKVELFTTDGEQIDAFNILCIDPKIAKKGMRLVDKRNQYYYVTEIGYCYLEQPEEFDPGQKE